MTSNPGAASVRSPVRRRARRGIAAGIPLPPDLRGGPIVAGVDDAIACGRPLRAAVFLSRATGRPLLLVHVRRRAMPMVEGYVPLPEEMGANDEAEDAVEAELVRALNDSGDLAEVTWELVSTTGDAGAELVRIAEERDAACVVVGKRHTGFADLPAPDRVRFGLPGCRRPAEVPRAGGALIGGPGRARSGR